MTDKKKLVVTGAQGFVAGSVIRQARDDWQVHAISRGAALSRSEDLDWHICDPLDPTRLAQLLRKIRPDAVIHAAAAADIDFCQANAGMARAVNVEFTRTLVEFCADSSARLVFCSTDTVFDGEHAPYSEASAPGPVNLYGETKVEAEGLVSRMGANGAIARLALVVGLPMLGSGNSFLVRMIAALKEGRTVSVPDHEVRTPVDVITAGRALLEFAGSNARGIFHIAGHSRLNRLEMARKIALRFGFPQSLVVAQAAAATSPSRAPRPRDVSLVNSKACAQLETPMLNLDDGISSILQSVKE